MGGGAQGRRRRRRARRSATSSCWRARSRASTSRICKSLADEGKKQVGSGVVAIVGVTDEGKAGIVVGVTDDLTARFNAVDLVRKGAEALGGKGGGGRPDMAQAGGPDGAKADAALAAIEAALGADEIERSTRIAHAADPSDRCAQEEPCRALRRREPRSARSRRADLRTCIARGSSQAAASTSCARRPGRHRRAALSSTWPRLALESRLLELVARPAPDVHRLSSSGCRCSVHIGIEDLLLLSRVEHCAVPALSRLRRRIAHRASVAGIVDLLAVLPLRLARPCSRRHLRMLGCHAASLR